MLVLTRKTDEQVVIGGNIFIKILSVRNGQVRLGFDAPKDVHILREELRDLREGVTSGRDG